MKHFFYIITLFVCSVSFGQHKHNMKVSVDIQEKLIRIQDELTYYNNSPDTLQAITFFDWNNAFSDKNSALAKRFSDEFIRSFSKCRGIKF